MFRRTIIGVLTAAVLIAGWAANATASSLTVTQAIKAQDRVIHANATYKSLKGFKIDTAAEAAKAIPKYVVLQKLIDTAATSVAGATATAAQKTGQKDWVSGARELAKGIGYFVTELNDVVHNNKTAAKTEAIKAEKLLSAGSVAGSKGDRLLGLPAND